MLPSRSQPTTTTRSPAMAALAGLVPCALDGDQADVAVVLAVRRVEGADGEQPGIFALAAGIGLQRDAGETGGRLQPGGQAVDQRLDSPRSARAGANGWRSANPGSVTGIISAVAFSFMVQEPSGIMLRFSATSLSSRRLR